MKTLLMVDDSQFALNSMQRCLQKHYNLLTAKDGYEAIAIAKEKCPDLIMLDVLMPKMHGLECCTQLKGSIDTKHIPIIFVTSMADPQTEIMAFRAGASDFITKPFNVEVLSLRISRLLQ